MPFLLRYLDRLLIAAGVLVLVALSARTLGSLERAVVRDAPEALRLEGESYVLLYSLNSGMNKPAVLNTAGDVLVELSGWNSEVVVDGVRADLGRHGFHVELDRERGRGYLAFSSLPLRESEPSRAEVRKYQIAQVASLQGDRVVVEYAIIPNEPVHRAVLTLGLYRWYYTHLVRRGRTLSFQSSDLSRAAAEQHLRPRRLTPVQVTFSDDPQVEALANAHGIYALALRYEVRAPRPFQRTLLARLVLRAGAPEPVSE